MADNRETTEKPKSESPLSLRRLTDAFAAMMGHKPKRQDHAEQLDGRSREVAVDVRSITEALLFVGLEENAPLSAQQLSGTMRDITPDEVTAAVAELNVTYQAEGSAFCIASEAAGYRLVLRSELERVREKFFGRVRQATLTPQAMEALSVVAYQQPVTAEQVDQLRREKSQSLLSGLVRKGLLRLERPEENPKQPVYYTTQRFLKVFGLNELGQLPKAEEFDLPAFAPPQGESA